jgi:hypothetical protein
MEQVSKDVAIADVNRWMDSKKIRPSKRTEYKQHIESLVSAVEDCLISVEDDNTITQTLLFPIGEGEGVKTLTFKNRLNTEQVKPFLKNIDAGDGDGRLNAYICALTSSAVGIINKLDSEDKNISQSIAVFFL